MTDSTATHDTSGPADELAEILDRYLADLRDGHAHDRAELLTGYGHLASELEPCLELAAT
jgi:hypothetical protein